MDFSRDEVLNLMIKVNSIGNYSEGKIYSTVKTLLKAENDSIL